MLAYGRSRRTLRFSYQGVDEEISGGGQYGVTSSGISLSLPLETSDRHSPARLQSTPPLQAVTTPQNPGQGSSAPPHISAGNVDTTTHDDYNILSSHLGKNPSAMKGRKDAVVAVAGAQDRDATTSRPLRTERRLVRPRLRVAMDFGDDSDDSPYGKDGDDGAGSPRINSAESDERSRNMQKELAESGAYRDDGIMIVRNDEFPARTAYEAGVEARNRQRGNRGATLKGGGSIGTNARLPSRTPRRKETLGDAAVMRFHSVEEENDGEVYENELRHVRGSGDGSRYHPMPGKESFRSHEPFVTPDQPEKPGEDVSLLISSHLSAGRLHQELRDAFGVFS